MNAAERLINTIINVLLWVLIIIIAFFAIVTFSQKGDGNVMNLFGYTPMTVLSDSMAPTFEKDDLIIVHHGDAASYQVDDIISFWTVLDGKKVINTHRILSVYSEGGMVQYTTKGDANLAADTYVVGTADVIGKYVAAVPLLGSVLSFLGTSLGFLMVIVLPLLAFFVYQIYRLVTLLIEVKRQTVMEATRAAMEQLEQERRLREDCAPSPDGAATPEEPKE